MKAFFTRKIIINECENFGEDRGRIITKRKPHDPGPGRKRE